MQRAGWPVGETEATDNEPNVCVDSGRVEGEQQDGEKGLSIVGWVRRKPRMDASRTDARPRTRARLPFRFATRSDRAAKTTDPVAFPTSVLSSTGTRHGLAKVSQGKLVTPCFYAEIPMMQPEGEPDTPSASRKIDAPESTQDGILVGPHTKAARDSDNCMHFCIPATQVHSAVAGTGI